MSRALIVFVVTLVLWSMAAVDTAAVELRTAWVAGARA
tara:strand:+ start:1024 stop:1137 length:114 start_codon:yes stop_codon:yes gene_type:complete